MSFTFFTFLTSVLVKATFASGDYDTDFDWRPIFKVSAGATDQWYYDSTSNLFDWWTDSSKSTYDNIYDDLNAAKLINPSRKESTNYKSLIINDWYNYRWVEKCFDQVRVSVFRDGKEVAYIIFSAVESYTNTDWFDRNQIESTSWYDLPGGHYCDLPIGPDFNVDINSGCVFSIKGDINTGAYRNFYINRNYGGCPNDDGWLGISTQDRCFDGWNPDELQNGQPTIHYSKNKVIGNFATDTEHGTGDTFVVSINGCHDERRDDKDDDQCVVYASTYLSRGSWSCSTQTDDEIDDMLAEYCSELNPGSRSITGNDIMNGAYMNIEGLPDKAHLSFLPSCPGCGNGGSDNGCSADGRLRVDQFSPGEDWSDYPDDWDLYFSGDLFLIICVFDEPCDKPDETPNPTEQPTEEPGRRDDDEDGCLVYINTYFNHDDWDCSTQSDDEINALLNDRCYLAHPGSRSVRGDDLINNGYLNIVGLPDNVPFSLLPSCPGCGTDGSDMGCSADGRLYIDSLFSGEEWSNFPNDWFTYSRGDSYSYMCIYDNCADDRVTPSPTQQPESRDDGGDDCLVYGGGFFLHADPQYEWSCNTQTDDEIDGILDFECNDRVPGSRAITGDDLIIYGYENIVGLEDALSNAPGSFLPSCPGCGNGGSDNGCSAGGRLYVDALSSKQWSDYPDNFDLRMSGSSISVLCVFDNCNES